MMNILFAAARLPDPESIRRAAQEVVSRPEFQIRPTSNGRALWDIAWRLLRPIICFFSGLWDISPALAWVVMIGLTVLAVLLVGHIVYTFKHALARRTRMADPLSLESRKIDPIELERQ